MDKILDNDEYYCERYSCACMDSGHVVDISIEFSPERKVETLLVDFAEKYSAYTLWERVKRAFLLLRGKELWGRGFLIRQEDIPSLIKLFKKALIK